MATLLFGGAEGVLAQDPMTGVIGSLPRHFGGARYRPHANLKYNPTHSRTALRARARGPSFARHPLRGLRFFSIVGSR
jgi:hypothetical protein